MISGNDLIPSCTSGCRYTIIIIRGEPERAPNTRETGSGVYIYIFIYLFICA